MKFIDEAYINLKAGNGGHGCIAFLREKFRAKGGPCGGDGGRGGHIILKVNNQLTTLQDISYLKHYKAERGQHGSGKNKHGKNGKNLIIEVPAGTIVKNSATEQIIADLTKADEEIIIAKGGNGGFGNARFKTKIHNAPRIANDGMQGEEIDISLELKLIADIGLVGFPNAGKSTFISKVSNAKPKIADYPFTTLTPNLGIVTYEDYKSFVIADIPGLIEGASSGKGLGIKFLKHIERTKALVFMIDIISEDINAEYKTLLNELNNHSKDLLKKPKILFITKSDIIKEDEHVDIDRPKNINSIIISSVNGHNIQQSIQEIKKILEL